jgi:Transcriptional regulator
MLTTAAGLFQRQGYHHTGVNQIVAESGAPKGSLYFHFPGGKQQLASEAIGQSGAFVASVIDETLAANADVASAMVAFCGLMAAQLEATDFAAGCPVATVALETAAMSPELANACDQTYRSWSARLVEALRREGCETKDAEAKATLALAAMQGALLLSKVARSTRPLTTIAEQLRDLLAPGLSRADRLGMNR